MVKDLYSIVTRKGQITLPAEMRRALDIQEGDKVALSLVDREELVIVVRPARSVAEATFGAVQPLQPPADLDTLRRAFEEDLAAQAVAESRNASEKSR